MPDRRRLHRYHPAESVGATAGMSGVIAALALGDTLAAGLAAVGLLPCCVTFIVRRGGLRGMLIAIWRGE